jgi:hypothetical protein
VREADPIPVLPAQTQGQRGQEGGGAAMGEDLSRLPLDPPGPSAVYQPGGGQAAQGTGAGAHPAHPGQAHRARGPGTAPLSPRVEGRLWGCRGPLPLQGMGLVDAAAPALLFVEAMGAARGQGAAATWGESRLGLEHDQVRPRSMALEPASRSGHCLARQLFRWPGGAETVHPGIISTELPWYVIRMPGGVGGAGPRCLALSRFGRCPI